MLVCLPSGPMLPGFPMRRGPMVEKAVQTLHVAQSRQRGSAPQPDSRWVRRRWFHGTRSDTIQTRTSTGASSKKLSPKWKILI